MPRVFQRRGPPVSNNQKAFLATPTFFGGIAAGYVSALFNSRAELEKAGIGCELCLLEGNPSVDSARNELVAQFLETDCTDLVFLDADLHWEPSDLVKLLQYDRDVVGGTYPAKDDKAERFVAYLPEGENWAEPDGLLEAECVPTGFLRIRRHVLEKMAESAPKYCPGGARFGCKAPWIFEHKFEEGRLWGEDFAFCRKWRRLGGKVYVAPEMWFQHYGPHCWQGNYGGYLRRKADISLSHCLREIAKGSTELTVFQELRQTWNNERHTCSVVMLMALAKLARQADGPIIEFGSGLTTLVMRAATCQPITAYEEDAEWGRRTIAALGDLPLVDLVAAELGPDFYQLNGESGFALAMCDGPESMEHRGGQFAALEKVLRPGGTFVIDDTYAEHRDAMLNWAARVGANFQIIDCDRPFAIGKMNEH